MNNTNLVLLISRIPPKLMLLIMFTLAAGATAMMYSSLNKPVPKLVLEKTPIVTVVAATRDIQEGETLNADSLKMLELPAGKVPQGALQNTNMAVGMKAKTSLHADDLLLSQFVSYPEKATGFESKIRPGHRAFTIPVDANTGVAGFLTPESHVDIMVQSGTGNESKTAMILSDVQIIAVGQQFKKDNGTEAQPVNSVTVSVSPQDAGKLANAMSTGKLYCLMRNSKDYSPVQTMDVSRAFPKAETPKSDLASMQESLPLPAVTKLPPPQLPKMTEEQARLRNVDMWAGSKKDQVEFQEEK